MKKKKHAEHVNHERWLVSYADFITLLFAFFVVMFAASNADHQKAGKIAKAVEVAFNQLAVFEPGSKSVPLNGDGASVSEVFSEARMMEPSKESVLMKNVKSQLEVDLKDEIQKNVIHVAEDSRGVTVSLAEAGFFDSGSAAVKEGSLPALQLIAEKLRDLPQNLRVEGHTDNTPIHTSAFPSNWELSTARATNVLQYLISAHIPPQRLSAVGYGEFHPAASNTTPEGRARNRRVDLVIIGATAQKLEPDGAHADPH
jgi:chemotaxis protein MotB